MKLKLCPFCGQEPELSFHGPKIDGKYQYGIECVTGNCPMDYVGGHSFISENDAIKAWNTRYMEEE